MWAADMDKALGEGLECVRVRQGSILREGGEQSGSASGRGRGRAEGDGGNGGRDARGAGRQAGQTGKSDCAAIVAGQAEMGSDKYKQI